MQAMGKRLGLKRGTIDGSNFDVTVPSEHQLIGGSGELHGCHSTLERVLFNRLLVSQVPPAICLLVTQTCSAIRV